MICLQKKIYNAFENLYSEAKNVHELDLQGCMASLAYHIDTPFPQQTTCTRNADKG